MKYLKLETPGDKARIIRDPRAFASNSILRGRCKRTVPNERLKSGHSTSPDGTLVAGDVAPSINKDHRRPRAQIISPNRLPSGPVHFCSPKTRVKGPRASEDRIAGRRNGNGEETGGERGESEFPRPGMSRGVSFRRNCPNTGEFRKKLHPRALRGAIQFENASGGSRGSRVYFIGTAFIPTSFLIFK